ncbi:hypothetical protein [Saccharibacillus sacchari]|uniref:Uncharacterized protein n=1 Tax=Saccharibacillus sacchari TaxID=456493 RepID=A0ACC6PFG1_9BACL
MNALERKILGILRRHRWFAFRLLSMTGLMRRSGGAFRDVAITLVNLEQGGYIWWPDKSSLKHISVLRKSYTLKAVFTRSLNRESNETIFNPPYLSTQEERTRSKRRPNGPEQSSRRQRAVD